MNHVVIVLLAWGGLLLAASGLASEPSTEPPESAATIAVIGSSVAAGWVTSYAVRYDMENGFAARLGRSLDSTKFRIVNLSVPGDNTGSVLRRFDRDVLPVKPDFALIALSLSNEGLETMDPDSVCGAFEDGLRVLIERCRQNGVLPVIASCYPNDGYTERQYGYLKATNLRLYSWGLPCVNLLGAVDDGSGHFVAGHTYDEGHPDDLGHEEMFLSIVPTLFEAIQHGKEVVTEITGERFVTIGADDGGLPLSWVPSDAVHSFTFAFWFRSGGEGTIGSIENGSGATDLRIEDGVLTYAKGAKTMLAAANLAPDEWHHVAVVQRYLKGETELFVDGTASGVATDRYEPLRFVVGGSPVAGAARPKSSDYRVVAVYRTALTATEVASLYRGLVIPASLEVLAPLEEPLLRGQPTLNLAQSLAELVAYPAGQAEQTALLRRCYEQADSARSARLVVKEKPVVAVPDVVLRSYIGTYEIEPGASIQIVQGKGGLDVINPYGDRMRLYAESAATFFVRYPLLEITITFVESNGGSVSHLVLRMGESEVQAKRLSGN